MIYTIVVSLISYTLGVVLSNFLLNRSKKVDMNELAREITLEEGHKESLDIAQVKEVLRITLKKLAKMSKEEVNYLLNKNKFKKEIL